MCEDAGDTVYTTAMWPGSETAAVAKGMLAMELVMAIPVMLGRKARLKLSVDEAVVQWDNAV